MDAENAHPLRGLLRRCVFRVKAFFSQACTDKARTPAENTYMQVIYNAGCSFICRH